MSLSNWLKKLWKAIRSIFNGFPANLKKAVHTGVIITENIKKFVESPAADILTAIIPGDLDEKVKVALRKSLPAILIQLKLADKCSQASTPEAITACAIETIQTLTGDIKSAFLHNLSIMIAQVAADGKLSWQDGVYIMEWYYQHKFNTAE
ncbi:hypothetical protein KHS38_09615 [Mucilaginibacter sp. Bleaf8]|uniref:hypothetical protein n=1 Tax=Mucilaginibacter sp. Bleaf8 TaxID=2834430 RepID=UPI001BD0F8CB|nr:hypothetical protein [Mucilaginibacter sp. Bleaf8]MBS7564660.1 hypothetical protein [Mucilaginibacter sp. Bleaf8]